MPSCDGLKFLSAALAGTLFTTTYAVVLCRLDLFHRHVEFHNFTLKLVSANEIASLHSITRDRLT